MVTKNKIKGTFFEIIRGYLSVFKSLLFRIDYEKLNFPVKISTAIIIMALIGIIRTLIHYYFGFIFADGVWYTPDPAVLFTMAVWINFLCFFPAMIIDYTYRSIGVKVNTRKILGFAFFVQFIHVIVLLFDFLQITFGIPYAFPIQPDLYLLLSISPLALTPLIFLITIPTSLGTTIGWFLASALYIKHAFHHKALTGKLLLALGIIFYVSYVISYPTLMASYMYKNNFFYGMTYVVAIIGALIYFKSKNIK